MVPRCGKSSQPWDGKLPSGKVSLGPMRWREEAVRDDRWKSAVDS